MAPGGPAGAQKPLEFERRNDVVNFRVIVFRDYRRIKYLVAGRSDNCPYIEFYDPVFLFKINGIGLACFLANSAATSAVESAWLATT